MSKLLKKYNFKKILVSKIKNWSWQEWVLFSAIFILLIIYFIHINSLQQLPSPVFGGDYYRDRGFIKNIIEGNPIWSDGFYLNEIQYYPYFLFIIQAGISKLTTLNIDTIFLLFPLLTLIFSSIIWYLLGLTIFKNKNAGLLTSLTFIVTRFSISPKSSTFAALTLVPLFLYLWLKYEITKKKKYAILSGISLGSISLFHGGRFLAAFSIITIYIIITFISKIYKKQNLLNTIKKYIKKYYLIFGIAILISLIFFLPLLLKYQMHSVNNVTEWGDTKLELLGPSWAFNILGNMFFNISNPFTFLISIISLVGLLILIFSKKTFRLKWLLLIFISNLIAIQHHLITKPILNVSFLPEKLNYLHSLTPFFFVLGAIFIIKYAKKYIKNKYIPILIIILLLIVPQGIISINNTKNSKWQQYGAQKNEYTNSLYNLADWMTNNIPKNETILSNDESGFMLAVLSGKKVMLTRRTHANYYIDIDQRIAEASVAMYGDDLNLSKQILQKYHVNYLYIDEHLLKYPMRTRPEFSNYLTENGINFSLVYDRYDIAKTPETANMMELLLIPPQKLNAEFEALWAPVYQVHVQQQTVGILYKLK